MSDAGEQPQIQSNADWLDAWRLTAPSATRNVGPIVEAMRPFMPDIGSALEIASGTGQHVVAYAAAFPGITWQPTDVAPERLISVDAWRAVESVQNVRIALRLDAATADWHAGSFDIVTVTNLFHLIPETDAVNVIAGAARTLATGGRFLVYGPFRVGGVFRSEGDAEFHARLTASDPAIGYKSIEWLTETAEAAGLRRAARRDMPANNLFLVFERA